MISKYQAFLKAIELGSLTEAARELQYTQSAVSRMIAALEEEWGLTLLVRSRSGICVTSDGEQLLPYLRAICQKQKELAGRVAELHDLDAGLVRIGSFTSVSVQWLPEILKSFHARYPKIDFELLEGDYTEIETWILQGLIDCGFVTLPAHPALTVYFLQRDRLLAVLPEEHPLASASAYPLARAASDPFLMLEENRDYEIQRIFDQTGIRPNVRCTSRDDYAIMAMAECGIGVSILSELVLRRSPYRIVCKELDEPRFRDLGIAVASPDTASRAALAFLRHVRRWINTEPPAATGSQNL